MVDTQHLVVDDRYGGPPGTGNGGYVSGLLAGAYEGPVEVTLRLPPPLGRPLRISPDGDERTVLLQGT
ncbi:MAG: hypothetical protein ACRDVM_07805, partial [Acidimicrobiia bacterium]